RRAASGGRSGSFAKSPQPPERTRARQHHDQTCSDTDRRQRRPGDGRAQPAGLSGLGEQLGGGGLPGRESGGDRIAARQGGRDGKGGSGTKQWLLLETAQDDAADR